jgi:hypothetical protein
MPIFRRPTPKGQPYTPNPEPGEEYTETVDVTRLTRRQKQVRGVLPKGRLPRGSR